MWSCRISVVNSTTLGEMCVHHNIELGLTDIALVFNNSESEGHFSALLCCNKELLIGGKAGKGQNYNLQEDIKERLLLGKYGWREMMLHFELKLLSSKILEWRKY